MKKLILTGIAVVALAASSLAQGTIALDNLNGTGGNTATSFGLFFDAAGAPYAGNVNVTLLGGANAGSMQPIATLLGANALLGIGGGIALDPMGATYIVPGVALGSSAVISVLAWIGPAATYGAAADLPGANVFLPWNGSAYVDARGLAFNNPTGGGGDPPGPPKSLDGMPAMRLGIVPEPSSLALLGLGVLGLLFRRK